MKRVCRVCGALAALLVFAATCRAAGPEMGPGSGGVGGQIGIASFRPDRMIRQSWFGDYSAGSLPRVAFTAQFRYVFRPWLRAQVSPGLTWTAYKGGEPAPFRDPRFGDATKKEMLTILVPVSLQVQYLLRRGWWVYHAGAGPNLSRLWIENRRKVIKDPETLRLHRGLYPGASGELGVEIFLKQLPATSVELTVGGDLVLAQRHEQFPAGFDSNVLGVGARLGGNYYFTPGVSRKRESTPAPAPAP